MLDSSIPEGVAPRDAHLSSASDTEYTVGYKRPPLHSRFQPGQSGNPRGRPPKPANVDAIVQRCMYRRMTVNSPSGTKRMTFIEALITKSMEAAAQGDLKSVKLLLDLLERAERAQSRKTNNEPPGDPAAMSAADLAAIERFRRAAAAEAGPASGEQGLLS